MTTDTSAGGSRFIAPLEITLPIDGVDVTITPMVMAELPRFVELTLPVFAALPPMADGFVDRMQSGTLTEAEMTGLLTALAVNGSNLVQLLALCTRQPVEWLGQLLPDRAAELVAVAFQVNADFFRRAMPNLRAMASRLKASASMQTPASASPSATTARSPSS